MLTRMGIGLVCTLSVLATAQTAPAQRGMGDETGVAQRPDDVDRVTVDGTVKEIITEPCKKTTGKFPVGMHVLLKTDDGVRNVHLGPAAVLEDLPERLKPGRAVHVKAFRTKKMPKDHCVAITVRTDDRTVRLRDDDLRPRWAVPQPGNRRRGDDGADRARSGRRMRAPARRGTEDGRPCRRGHCLRRGQGCGMGRNMTCRPHGRRTHHVQTGNAGQGCGPRCRWMRGAGGTRGFQQGPGEEAPLQRRLNALEEQVRDLLNELRRARNRYGRQRL